MKPPFSISHGDNGGATNDISPNSVLIFTNILTTIPTIQLTNTTSLKPTSSVLYPHLFAKTAYYQTAEFPNLDDMVRFSPEAWDHPSRELMIHIVEKKLFDNIPKKLTAKIIRNHFPQCVACLAGNMAQKPVPHSISTTEYIPEEVLQIDIKVFADTSKARKHLRAFGNYVGAYCC